MYPSARTFLSDSDSNVQIAQLYVYSFILSGLNYIPPIFFPFIQTIT